MAGAPITPQREAFRRFLVAQEWLVEQYAHAPVPALLSEHYQDPARTVYDLSAEVGQAYGPEVQAALEARMNHDVFFDLGSFTPNLDLVRKCPQEWSPTHEFLLVEQSEHVYVIATPTPRDPALKRVLLDKLKPQWESQDIQPTLFFVRVSQGALAELLPRAKQVASARMEVMVGKPTETPELVLAPSQVPTLEELVELFETARASGSQASPKRMLDVLLARAYSPDDPSRRASDVHIEPRPGDAEFLIRYRIGGKCVDIDRAPMSFYPQFATAIKGACAPMNMTERGKLQDGRYQLKLRVRDRVIKLDLRVVCLPVGSETGGDAPEKFVFRILDSSSERPSVSDLVNGDAGLEQLVRRALDLPHGLILLTGPTGSGKTTTLSRFVMELARNPAWSIYTVEDPVEYEYDPIYRVCQTQTDEVRGITFPNVLRSLLRADPDIILVGEMRDELTAELVVRASLTGHQVFSTLHTNDAVGAISRLTDMNVRPYYVADVLSMVVAQRLEAGLCKECKQPYEVTGALKADLPEKYQKGTFYRAVGCSKCHGSGYAGRVPILDIMYVDETIKALIAREAPLEEIRTYNELTYSPGLYHRALALAQSGRIDLLTAFSVRDALANPEKGL